MGAVLLTKQSQPGIVSYCYIEIYRYISLNISSPCPLSIICGSIKWN